MKARHRALKAVALGLVFSAMFPGLLLTGSTLLLPYVCAEAGPQLCRHYGPRLAILLAGMYLVPWVACSIYCFHKPLEKPLIGILRDEVCEPSLGARIRLASNLVGWALAGMSPLLLYRVLGSSASPWVYLAVAMACWFGGGLAGLALGSAYGKESEMQDGWKDTRIDEQDPRPSPELTVEGMRLAATWAGIASSMCVLAMWGIVWPRLTHVWLQRDLLYISFLTPLPYGVALAAGVLARLITLQLLVSGTVSRKAAIIGSAIGTTLVSLGAILLVEFA